MILVALAVETLRLDAAALPAPVAKVVPVVRDIHGDKFVDPYAWMRNREDKDLLPYLKANNAYADAVMKSTQALQGRLYREFVSRMKESDLSVPTFDRGYYYYSKTLKGKQYALYCRRKGSMKAREEVLLDPNALAKGSGYFSVGAFEISPNSRLLAYSVDKTGYRQYRAHIKDLATGKTLAWSPGIVVDLVWASDNRTLFYTVENDAKRNYRAYRVALGGKPTLLYEEKDAMFDVGLSQSRDDRFALLMSYSKETTEGRLIDLSQPSRPPALIAPRREGVEYYPEVQGKRLLLRTNDGAPEFRLVAAPLDRPMETKEILPEQPGATLEGVDAFERFAVLQIRKNAVAGLAILDTRTNRIAPIAMPDAYYTASLADNPDFRTKRVRFSYTSMATPQTTFEYDVERRKLVVLKRQPVPGYVASKYKSELRWITARDGVRVPVAMMVRQGTKFPAPMLLEAYGAYGAPNDPYFSSSMLSLLDRGVIVGTALVRGGGEMGEKWHDAGKMARKLTTFTDLIDVCKALADQKVTTANRLCLMGGSAGGLTLGATMNMAPEICRAALVYVPFVDVVNTMLDESIPLTTQEFIEWGNPKIEEQYRWIRSYSPYDNVGALDYPAMLVRTSLNDSQVPYWEPCKWVARLRALRTDADPLLLKVDLSSGHGGASGRYDSLRDRAYDFAFVLAMIGEKH